MLNGYVTEKIKTEDSCELPIFFPPPIKTYLPYSIISSIILANDDTYSWLYNNFIQIYKKPFVDRIEFYPGQDFFYADQSLLNVNELSSQNFILGEDELIEYLIHWIDNNNYVIICLLESEVPGTRFHKYKIQKLHSQFIFGYNKKEKIFKIMNFSGKTDDLSILDIGFEAIARAFRLTISMGLHEDPKVNWTFSNKKFRILLVRFKEHMDSSYVRQVDINIINKQLNNYLNSRNSSLDTNFFTTIQEGSWGMSIYNEIKSYLKNVQQGSPLDLRMFHLIFEHKVLMLLRFKQLTQKYGVNIVENDFENLKNIASVMRNLCIKYNFTFDVNVIKQIESLIDKLYCKEAILLEKYLTDHDK